MAAITEKNIFESGAFVSINLGSWQARCKLRDSDLEGVDEKRRKIMRGVQDLLTDKELLDKITSHDNKTRNHIKARTVPFTIDGVYFVLGKDISEIIEYIEERKAERLELVNEFIKEKYQPAIEAFKEEYPEVYEVNQNKYPSADELLNKFYFRFNFFQVNIPSKQLDFISADLYKAEMDKFKDQISEMKREVCNIIYTELLETVGRLQKQSTEGKPNQRTLNTLDKFLSRIDETYNDFLERKDLKGVIDSVRKMASGVTANQLRDDQKFKTDFAKKTKEILKDIKALPDVEAKRAIII